MRRCAEAYEDELSARNWADLRRLGCLRSPTFSFGDFAAAMNVADTEAEQLLDVMLEVHAVQVTRDGRFEMPRWLHAYLVLLAKPEHAHDPLPRS